MLHSMRHSPPEHGKSLAAVSVAHANLIDYMYLICHLCPWMLRSDFLTLLVLFQ